MELSVWQQVTGILFAALGALSMFEWRNLHKRVQEKAEKEALARLEATVKEKAEATAVLLLAAEVKAKADASLVHEVTSRLDKIFENQRQDNQNIFQEIRALTKIQAEFSQRCMEEMGKRPTREELRDWCEIRHSR